MKPLNEVEVAPGKCRGTGRRATKGAPLRARVVCALGSMCDLGRCAREGHGGAALK